MVMECALPRYGDRLVMVASQEMRERVLCPVAMESPLPGLSDLQYAILEVVGASRELGVSRPFFMKYLHVEASSVFYHVKMLRLAGLVTIKVCAELTTPLLHHSSSGALCQQCCPHAVLEEVCS